MDTNCTYHQAQKRIMTDRFLSPDDREHELQHLAWRQLERCGDWEPCPIRRQELREVRSQSVR